MTGDASPVLVDFGARVRRMRLAAGYSQEELAHRAGLDRTYISGIERGRRNVSLVNIVRIAEALSVDPGYLVARSPRA